MRTDIAGAAASGIDSVLVARGIHAIELGLEAGSLDIAHVRRWLAEQEFRPIGVCEHLVWE
jgi:ribonucleotide monophosphatase NagD (HAD superfamily)